jgi:hypothetical protein
MLNCRRKLCTIKAIRAFASGYPIRAFSVSTIQAAAARSGFACLVLPRIEEGASPEVEDSEPSLAFRSPFFARGVDS